MKEIDEDFTDEELDGIISEVSLHVINQFHNLFFQIDADGSGTIDFDEFCNIMT